MGRGNKTTTPKRMLRDSTRYKKRQCAFCVGHTLWIDYKDITLLVKFMTDRGKVKGRRLTGNCARHQKDIALAIKTARELALLSYSHRLSGDRLSGDQNAGRSFAADNTRIVPTRAAGEDQTGKDQTGEDQTGEDQTDMSYINQPLTPVADSPPSPMDSTVAALDDRSSVPEDSAEPVSAETQGE